MIFINFFCEFYRISNVITCETLILNYNGEFNLGICLYIYVCVCVCVCVYKFKYSCYDFSNLILYIFNFINNKKNYLTLWFD